METKYELEQVVWIKDGYRCCLGVVEGIHLNADRSPIYSAPGHIAAIEEEVFASRASCEQSIAKDKAFDELEAKAKRRELEAAAKRVAEHTGQSVEEVLKKK